MASLQDLLNQLNSQYANQQQRLNQQYQARADNILNQLGGMGGQGQYGQLGGGLQGLLNKHPGIGQPARKPLIQDPKTRIVEIDKELDIIRGVVPTPKGYKINRAKAKSLMTERTTLEKDLTK